MAYIKNPSAEQKKEWIEKAKEQEQEAFKRIREVIDNYREDPEKIREYFQFASNFYNYSSRNVSLIYAQNPNATFVQSFEGWKKMDSHIEKGSVGIKILVPVKVTYLNVDDENKIQLSKASKELKEKYKRGEIEAQSVTRFKVGNVFDISQTNFPKEKYPDLFDMGKKSMKHRAVTNGLIEFAEQEIHCTVSTENLESIALLGFYTPSKHNITLNERMEDTVRLSTMSHELGHALEHWSMPDTSVAQKEFEGDAISIMIQQRYGIEITEQRARHITGHFKAFEKECCDLCRNKLDIKESDVNDTVNQMIQESFSSIFTTFKENIDKIDFHIQKAEELEKSKMKFYVSECGKYHNIGFYKENLSLEEAVKEYKAMIHNPDMQGESNELGIILQDDSIEEFVAIVSGNLMCMSKEEAADLNNHFLQQSITELKKDFTESKTKETRKLEKNPEIKNPSGKRKNLHLDMDLG